MRNSEGFIERRAKDRCRARITIRGRAYSQPHSATLDAEERLRSLRIADRGRRRRHRALLVAMILTQPSAKDRVGLVFQTTAASISTAWSRVRQEAGLYLNKEGLKGLRKAKPNKDRGLRLHNLNTKARLACSKFTA